jgi:hypothetical protein
VNTNTQRHHFYARTVNLTNISFTQEETTLLNKGLVVLKTPSTDTG